MTESVHVGVLSLHTSKETKAILNAIEELGHRGTWLREETLSLDVRDGEVTMEPDVDVVVNRLLLSNTEQPAELLGLANALEGVKPMLNESSDVLTAFHKFATATHLGAAGLSVPDAFLSLDADRLNEERPRFGDEAVFKTAIGTHGGGTWKVGREEDVNPLVGERYAFLQELIDRDEARHRDLRVYVVDGEVVASMRRFAPENDWRTNVALGGDVEGVTDLPANAESLAVDAAGTLGLDVAGVDLVEGADGWYVLEVNPTAGFKGLFRATGTSPAPDIARLAVERAGGSVDADAVDRLRGRFDTSAPSGAPTPSTGLGGEQRLIGYTEEVLVSGTSGTERVLAKSDTGASRTSLDTSLAAKIGAGPIKRMTKVKSGSMKQGKARPVVDIVVSVNGDRHTVAASLEDRGHMDYPLLLGRDILKHYQVDVTRTIEDAEGEAEEEEASEE